MENLEIERKFLVRGDFKTFAYKSERITQAYISTDPERSVRVRRIGEKAFLTIKGKGDLRGISRFEWEKEISLADANSLFMLCAQASVIDKTRYYIKSGELCFEVDEFGGGNKGLIVAEIELHTENEYFDKPEWLGNEVTGIVKYYNSYLSIYPYSKWTT